jgi:hypothetical protein
MDAQMATLAQLRSLWLNGRFSLLPLFQVASRFSRQLMTLVSAAVLFSAACFPALAADATNTTIRTGPQLKQKFEQFQKTEDGGVALRYFIERGSKPNTDGLSEIQFQKDNKDFSLFFVPFYEYGRDSKEGHDLVLAADGPNGTNVLLGTVTAQANEPPEVKGENVVTNGKVEPGKGQLRSFWKCTVSGCLGTAIRCVATGPDWPPCGLAQLFFPDK